MAASLKSMTARIIQISSEKIQEEEIRLISDTLRQGAVIAYPTDTFYGLGADIFSRQALQRIHRIKKRQASKPMPILVSDFDMAESLAAEIPPLFGSIAARFWPGPLTLVIKAAAGLPVELVGVKRTVGIRLPDVTWLRELIRRVGFPIAATSANISGAREIDSAEEVIRQFRLKVDLIVDAGRTPGGRPSTVLDLTGMRPVILREGAIPEAEIQRLLS